MNLLTVQELAAWLKVPKSWVYDRTRNGRIPCVKMGKYVRFNKEEIEEWLSRQEVRALRSVE